MRVRCNIGKTCLFHRRELAGRSRAGRIAPLQQLLLSEPARESGSSDTHNSGSTGSRHRASLELWVSNARRTPTTRPWRGLRVASTASCGCITACGRCRSSTSRLFSAGTEALSSFSGLAGSRSGQNLRFRLDTIAPVPAQAAMLRPANPKPTEGQMERTPETLSVRMRKCA